MESSKGVNRGIVFGSSIPVENVQSLASKNLNEIPPRYLRPELDYDQVVDDEALQVPVIDMNKLVVGDFGYEIEIQKLHLACKNWGFFQLINHGALDEIKKMKKVTEEFFKLPLEVKMLCAQPPNSKEGYGQLFVTSEEQKLDWADMFYLLTLPLSNRNLNLWPKTPSSFRPTLDEYSAKLKKVSINLLSIMAENLKVEPQKFTSMFDRDGRQGIRMNYYPPCIQAKKVLGLTPHSDGSALTLLVQVNDVEGLQIKKNQKWLPIKPISEAIIVNIGDTMELFVTSEEQKLDWADMFYLLTLPLSNRNLNLWPKTPSSFRPTLDEYSAKLKKVSINLLSIMAENLKVEPQKFTNMFDRDGRQGIRMNYYPPCIQAKKVLGLTPHSDGSALTLLVQVNDVEGLQIKKNQKWLPIKPISEAIIVNIGDTMEVLSNGEYRSIEHRAMVNNKKERLSIAAFHNVNIETNIGPLPEIVNEDEPKYKTMNHEDFVQLFMNRKLDGKSFLDQLKL